MRATVVGKATPVRTQVQAQEQERKEEMYIDIEGLELVRSAGKEVCNITGCRIVPWTYRYIYKTGISEELCEDNEEEWETVCYRQLNVPRFIPINEETISKILDLKEQVEGIYRFCGMSSDCANAMGSAWVEGLMEIARDHGVSKIPKNAIVYNVESIDDAIMEFAEKLEEELRGKTVEKDKCECMKKVIEGRIDEVVPKNLERKAILLDKIYYTYDLDYEEEASIICGLSEEELDKCDVEQ